MRKVFCTILSAWLSYDTECMRTLLSSVAVAAITCLFVVERVMRQLRNAYVITFLAGLFSARTNPELLASNNSSAVKMF